MKGLQTAPQTEKRKSPQTMVLTSSKKWSQYETEVNFPSGKLLDDLMTFMRKVVACLKPDLREAKMKADVDILSTACMNVRFLSSLFYC